MKHDADRAGQWVVSDGGSMDCWNEGGCGVVRGEEGSVWFQARACLWLEGHERGVASVHSYGPGPGFSSQW